MISSILDLPALAPPPGVEPNFENPETLQHPELAVLQFIIATVAVIIRLYIKQYIVGRLLSEDYWVLVAWLVFVGFQVLAFMIEELPLGVHQWNVTIRDALKMAKMFHIIVGVYALVVIPLKIAIILQIRRIFTPLSHTSRAQRSLRWTLDLFLVLNVIFYLALFLFQFLVCQPLEAAWNPFMPGKCVPNRFAVHIASASINTASDLILVLLPQPVIWGLTMNRKRQWGLSTVFLIGGLACLASAMRLYHAVLLDTATDQTYRGALMGKWSEPELMFGFLVACLPVVPNFIRHIYHLPGMRKICCCVSHRKSNLTPSDLTMGDKQIVTIGSDESGRSKKMLDRDIEFAELTRPDSMDCRSSKRASSQGEWHNGMHDEMHNEMHDERHDEDRAVHETSLLEKAKEPV